MASDLGDLDLASPVPAADVSLADSGGNTTATDVEAAIAELYGLVAAAGGGTEDPIADILGTPDTAFEFESSSLSGLTAIGTPDFEDADTTIPGCYYVDDDSSGVAYVGRFVNGLTPPFTAITKVTDQNLRNDFNLGGLLIGVSDPTSGAFVNWGVANAARLLQLNPFSNPSSAGSATGVSFGYYKTPYYLAIIVRASNSVDFYASLNGRLWRLFALSVDPGFTVASAGIGLASVNAASTAMAFDFLRIWNSAKTLPGGRS